MIRAIGKSGVRREWPRRKASDGHSRTLCLSHTWQWRHSEVVTVWQQVVNSDSLGVEVKDDECWQETESCREHSVCGKMGTRWE